MKEINLNKLLQNIDVDSMTRVYQSKHWHLSNLGANISGYRQGILDCIKELKKNYESLV